MSESKSKKEISQFKRFFVSLLPTDKKMNKIKRGKSKKYLQKFWKRSSFSVAALYRCGVNSGLLSQKRRSSGRGVGRLGVRAVNFKEIVGISLINKMYSGEGVGCAVHTKK